jgi:hypothetical protein
MIELLHAYLFGVLVVLCTFLFNIEENTKTDALRKGFLAILLSTFWPILAIIILGVSLLDIS